MRYNDTARVCIHIICMCGWSLEHQGTAHSSCGVCVCGACDNKVRLSVVCSLHFYIIDLAMDCAVIDKARPTAVHHINTNQSVVSKCYGSRCLDTANIGDVS